MSKQRWKAALAGVLVAGSLAAQGSGKQALLMALQANSKQMVTYQWKQKIAVFRGGNPVEPLIEEVRFDAAGQAQRITLAKPEEKRMGPLRARKAAEVKEDIQETMKLAGRYADPRQIAAAIQRGELWEGQGRIRIQARGLVLPIDDVTLTVSGASYLTSRIDIKTQHEGGPVTIAIDYEPMPGGPSVMRRMTVQIPRENIVVNVESFDFVRLAGPMIP